VEYTLKRFTLLKCGRWWNKDIEIDLLGIGEDFIIFGECKWQNKKVGIKVYKELVEKSKYIKSDLAKKYILFSKSGFSDELLELAKEKNELFLIKADEF